MSWKLLPIRELRRLLIKESPLQRVSVLGILICVILVNLIGVFGPEIGFDALWYHLTIPKLYLMAGQIYHIPGGLFYYSELPRLTEILYLPLLKYFGTTGPHLLSWGAGIGAAIVTYKLARKFLNPESSLMGLVIFYVTPLVSWQSGSGYIDLARTFWEVLALYFIFSKRPVVAGAAIGLAISTKTLALGSVFPLLLVLYFLTRNLRSCILYLISCILVTLPWFVSAYLNTGYALYPIGVGILDSSHNLNLDIWNLPKIAADFYKLWLAPEDPISPIYLLILPFLVLSLPKLRKFAALLTYCLLSYFVWFITPRTGGGRFILSYLPAFAILTAAAISAQKEQLTRRLLMGAVILVSLANLGYRLTAAARLVPYLSGKETKASYLCHSLDLESTYYRCPGKTTNGSHNLYYYYTDFNK